MNVINGFRYRLLAIMCFFFTMGLLVMFLLTGYMRDLLRRGVRRPLSATR